MKSKKTDRRSKRTQRLLGEALVALLLEKRYDTITVQDILERADIGRSTFYEQYWDKEDLLASEIEQMVNLLSQQVGMTQQDAPLWIPGLALFQHVYDHYHLYQALLRGRGVEIVTQALQNQLHVHAREQLRGELREREGDDLLEAMASYIVGAFITLLQWWLEMEMKWSPERMNLLFRNLVLPGVHHLLAQKTVECE